MMTRFQILLLLASTLGGLAAAYAFHFPLVIGFMAGLVMLTILCIRLGFSLRELMRPMLNGAAETKEVVWILLSVGVLIPVWTASGTIPYLIDMGIAIIPPSMFLTGCFLLSALIALLLGTSTGTLSFAGIPLIGVSAMLGVPLGYTAGALVSGAFVGERSSPFSSARRLVGASTGVELNPFGREMLPTALVGWLGTSAAYSFMDWQGGWELPVDHPIGSMFAGSFHYGPWLLIPPAVLLAAILFRFKTRNAFILSITAAVVIGWITQSTDTRLWLHYITYGYDDISLPSLRGKGVVQMIELVTLIMAAGAYNGILQYTRLAEGLWRRIVGAGHSMRASTIRIALFGLGLCLVSCMQTLPIMMSARNLLPSWREKFPVSHLTRIVSDTTMLYPPIVPWNLLALLCSAILGVEVIDFVPYAYFLWLVPLVTVAASAVYDWKKKKSSSSVVMIR